MSTVYENEKQFTNREIKAAKMALELYYEIGRPSEKVFLHALENNIIRDSPITATDAKRGFAIYGKDVANIKGKTKRSNPEHVQNLKLIALPEYIMKWHRDVTLCIDIFYVNKLPFFHTISRKLQFRTVEYIASESHESLLLSLQKVINIYNKRGFNIEYVCAEKQFESVREAIRPIHLKVLSIGEHVPEIEQSIQTVKGDIQTLYHSMPYKRFPPLIIKEMVEYQVSMRNRLPSFN